MKLRHELTLPAPLEQAWATLLDVEQVAARVPGATVEPGSADGLVRASMPVGLGPEAVTYEGAARLAEVDDDARAATVEVRAKEARGHGTASATIRARLERAGADATRVLLDTELRVTGPQARLGRDAMRDAAGRVLDELASGLEARLREPRDGAPAERPAPAPAAEPGLPPASWSPHAAAVARTVVGLGAAVGAACALVLLARRRARAIDRRWGRRG